MWLGHLAMNLTGGSWMPLLGDGDRDETPMDDSNLAADSSNMAKRTLAALLWFYAGWYAGSMIASILGVSEALGPVLGTAAAALIAGDPRHRIWTPRVSSERIENRLASITSRS